MSVKIKGLPATMNTDLADTRVKKLTEPSRARPYFVVVGKTSWRKPFMVYIATGHDAPEEVACGAKVGDMHLVSKALNDLFA